MGGEGGGIGPDVNGRLVGGGAGGRSEPNVGRKEAGVDREERGSLSEGNFGGLSGRREEKGLVGKGEEAKENEASENEADGKWGCEVR